MSEPLISIIICTYNRAKLLNECLASLSVQSCKDMAWDVIVVDNNCTDNSVEVAEKWRSKLNIRVVKEEKQGLSHARNAGLQNSNAMLVAYLDDDCTVSPGWLAAIADGFQGFPDTACFGGRINLRWEGGVQPSWMSDNVRPALGHQELSDGISLVRHVNGGNMIWVRQILLELGGFNLSLGRVGKIKLAGEESEVQEKARERGLLIRYLPDALAYHWVPKERQTRKHILHLCFMVGKSSSISEHVNNPSVSNTKRFMTTTKYLFDWFFLFVRSIFHEKFQLKGDAFFYLNPLIINLGKWLMDLDYMIILKKR